MLQNKLLLIATFAALACTGCFMGPVADNQVTSSLSISQAQCQMTVQNDSFAGLCAQIQISNTGVQAMQGWQLTFDLPASSHLQNSWNANFVIQGQHVVVTPLADQGNLDIGTTVMLGYCASQTGTNLVATPGSCDSTQGTAITQNANADASQVASAVATTKTVVSQVGWQALEGNIAGAPCRFTTLTVDRFGSDASLVPSAAAGRDAGLRSRCVAQCGRLRRRRPPRASRHIEGPRHKYRPNHKHTSGLAGIGLAGERSRPYARCSDALAQRGAQASHPRSAGKFNLRHAFLRLALERYGLAHHRGRCGHLPAGRRHGPQPARTALGERCPRSSQPGGVCPVIYSALSVGLTMPWSRNFLYKFDRSSARLRAICAMLPWLCRNSSLSTRRS